jgi:cation transport regulator ChaC
MHARLPGWRRRWSLKRDNPTCEKTFARADDGSVPAWVLSLNVEPAEPRDAAPNGVVFDLTEEELRHLDARELRYDRVEVTESIRLSAAEGAELGAGEACFERVVTYSARREHFAPAPPPDAIILASYARTVESAFAALGEDERRAYLETTGPHPVEVVEAVLVRDQIPPGNPRDW